MIELHIFWGIRYTIIIIIIIIIVIIIIIIIELCFSVFLLSTLQLYSFTSLAQSCRPLPVPQHRCNGARHGLFLDSFRLALSKLDIQELLQRPTASKKARRLGARGNWQIFCHRFLFGDVTTLIQCYSWGFDEETDTGSAALCMEHLPTKRNALSPL